MRRNPLKDNVLEPALTPEQLYGLAPKIREHASLDVQFITDVDSSQMKLEHREQMISAINPNLKKYDAVVLTHGTDTMATTANTLALAFGGALDKPVVITGSQMPPEDLGSDATANIERAVLAATTAVQPGVYLAFDRYVHAGTRVMKLSESALDAFGSPAFRPVATMTAHGLDWDDDALNKVKPVGNSVLNYFNPRVTSVTIEGDMPERELFRILQGLKEEETWGLVVYAPGTGNIAPYHLRILKPAIESGVPVVVASQMTGGRIRMETYQAGHEAILAGAIPANDMTQAAAKTKLSWALGMADQLIQMKRLTRQQVVPFVKGVFSHVRAGEVTLAANQENRPLPESVAQLTSKR